MPFGSFASNDFKIIWLSNILTFQKIVVHTKFDIYF
jgi:hypothetical protein